MGRKYSDAQILWLNTQGYSRVWKNKQEFLNKFNEVFNLSVDIYAFNNLLQYYDIKVCTRQAAAQFTDEQKTWLIENAKSGRFKNGKHLTDTYNVLFKECRKQDNLISCLCRWGVSLNTSYKSVYYSTEMDKWLQDNYLLFETTEEAVVAFNEVFKTNKTSAGLSVHARKLGIKRKSKRFGDVPTRVTKELYSISYRNDFAWIKINMKNDKSSWIPLHKYVWEQKHGKVPEGYCVVFISDDHTDVSLDNLALIDRRGTVIMSKFGWWTDNKVITKDGVQWCNLYCVAKDSGVVL